MPDRAPTAVFLSYASQNAEVARRICEALRSEGIEVWFDQSELRGGDVWDQKIRRQIKECALFVPVISQNTQVRREGYFRLEWRLADQRTHLMGRNAAFIVPVCIDDTRDQEADVPDSFLEVQWTRLPVRAGQSGPDNLALSEFAQHVKQLLGCGDIQFTPAPFTPPAPALQPPPPSRPPEIRPVPGKRRNMRRGALVALIVACAVAAYLALRPRTDAPASPLKSVAETKPPTPAAAPLNDKSIAVLPFANVSDDKEASAFFSDGVHEDILTNLANIREFRVVPRTSVEQYRGTKKKISQIAQELRVTYVLEGSVRRAGDQVRVTGQLSNARTEENLWAKAYNKTLTNVFSIQAELATDIAQALKTVLSPEEKTLVERRPTTSAAAYEQFLKAREVRRGFDHVVRNARAMEPFLLEAVRLDPNYAAAYAELVYVYTIDDTGAERQARLAKAQDAVDKASRLAPDSPEVILALGDYYLGSGDTARAVEQYERFGRLRPKDPDYLARLAETYQRQGRGMELKAWELRKQLEDVDPGNLANLYRTVNLLAAGRRYADAIAVQRRITIRLPESLEARHYLALLTFYLNGSTQLQEKFWAENKPDAWDQGAGWWRRWVRMQGKLDEAVSFDRITPATGDAEALNMAIIHAARGDAAAARARLGDLPERLRSRTADGGSGKNNVSTWLQLGTVEAVLGNRTEALRCAKRALELSPTPRLPSDGLARLYAWAGDKDSALAELGRSLLERPAGGYGTNNVHGMRRDANFFPLQGDPRFEALLNDPRNNAPLF